MTARLLARVRQAAERIRRGVLILRACLRHLADEDAWERHCRAQARPQRGQAGCAAEAGCCSGAAGPEAGTLPEAGLPVMMDRGRFWQEESERRWNGVRRCC